MAWEGLYGKRIERSTGIYGIRTCDGMAPKAGRWHHYLRWTTEGAAMRWIWLLTALVFAESAQAQTADRAGIWRLECKVDRMSDGKSCDVSTDISHMGKGRHDMIAGALTYSLPLQLMTVVTGGRPMLVRLRVDGRPPVSFECVGSGICLLSKVMGGQVAASMRKGGVILLDIQGSASYPEPKTFSLSGFDAMVSRAQAELKAR